MNFDVLISKDQIDKRVAEMGKEISEAYRDRDIGDELLIVGVLRGSFVFMADLVRHIDVPLKVDFIEASSYGSGTVSSGEVKFTRDIRSELKDKDVILVEDIVDTGNTLTALIEHIQEKKPRSVKICSFLHKPSRKEKHVEICYLGFTIDDHFVVGYGLDVDERYRNLDDVVIYSEEKEKKGARHG